MTRTAFLAALEQLLAPLPEAERKDALSYYEDYLDAAGPENEARAIAELGSPEEVARKILDEQSPQGTSAAPASPTPRSRWRMVLGGGLAVLVLACFFFQHSKATPVQPVEPASSAADSSSVPEEASSTYLAVPADTVPLPIPADDLGESTLQIPLEKLDQELKLSLNYGSVTFVTDPWVLELERSRIGLTLAIRGSVAVLGSAARIAKVNPILLLYLQRLGSVTKVTEP